MRPRPGSGSAPSPGGLPARDGAVGVSEPQMQSDLNKLCAECSFPGFSQPFWPLSFWSRSLLAEANSELAWSGSRVLVGLGVGGEQNDKTM